MSQLFVVKQQTSLPSQLIGLFCCWKLWIISFTSITWLQPTTLISVIYSSCIYTSEIRQCHENQSHPAPLFASHKGKPHSSVIVLSAYSTVAKQSHSHFINQPAAQKNTLAHRRTMTSELRSHQCVIFTLITLKMFSAVWMWEAAEVTVILSGFHLIKDCTLQRYECRGLHRWLFRK